MALPTPQNVTLKDFGAGMDQKSAENAIKPGYSERLTNVVTNSNGALSKRVGYEGHYGWMPLRVKSVQRTSGSAEIKLFFDSTVSFQNIVSTPVVVYGRLSETGISGADFEYNADNGHYYGSFSNSIPYTFTAPSGNTGGINGVGSVNVMTMTMKSTLAGSTSSEYVYIDSISVSTSGNNDITYTWSGLSPASPGGDIDVFLPTELISAAGTEYVWNYTTAADPETKTLTAATHQLANYLPIVQVYIKNGSNWEQAVPGDLTINVTTGEISHTTTGITVGTDVKVLFKTADYANITSGSITTSGSIAASTTVDFYLASAYVASGGTYTLIVPDSIIKDSAANTLTFSFSGLGGTETIYTVYTEAEIQANYIVLTDTTGDTTENYTDNNPQMTLWGIKPDDVYFGDNTTAAHVSHIDAYRSEGDERIVAGLTGFMTKAQTRSESSSEYQIGTTDVSIDQRVNTSVTVGPVFATTSETQSRTNGMVKDDTVADNKALVTAVEYVSSGVAKYTLSLPSPTGNLETAINITSGLEDYLTVSGMANSIHNGFFKITARDNAAKTITVSNTLVTSARYNETGARGRAGVFTDSFAAQSTTSFLPGDMLDVDPIDSVEVLTTSSSTVKVKGLSDYYALNAGTKIFAARTTALLPVASTDDFVLGDMCTLTSYTRKMRVVGLNPLSDNTITGVTWSSTTATVTLTTSAPNLRAGQLVNIIGTTDAQLNGEYAIVSIISETSFTITTSHTGSTLGSGGSVQGKTIEVDEAVDIYDANTASAITVVGRWIPVESPDTTYTLPKVTHYQYFTANDYEDQPRIKSTIISDNMYFTNYDDAVMKFDGTNIYKAGIPYWQPQHFVATSTSTPSIARSGLVVAASSYSGNTFTVVKGAQTIFAPGDIIVYDNVEYTVSSVASDNTDGYVNVTSSISGAASGDIRFDSRFKYYVRLNAIDANGNLVASAATGLDDYVVRLTADGVINHKFIGLPSFDLYDHDSINIEVYRTKAGKAAPYYKIGVTALNFDRAKGYVTFKDSTDDSLLTEFDAVNTALLGTEVGTAFAPPSRAKYITSANNRLLYMNTQSYPYITLDLVPTGGLAAVTFSSFNNAEFIIRKDNTDVSSTSNMIDRTVYKCVTSTTGSVSSVSIGSGNFTVTIADTTGMAAGDWVYLLRNASVVTTTNDLQLRFAGWYQIFTVDNGTTFTCKGYPTSGAFVANTDIDKYVWVGSGKVPVFLGTDYNINTVDGNDDNLYQTLVRLSAAINATHSMTDRALAAYSTFTPWLTAVAGSTIGAGKLQLRQDLVLSTTFEIELPTITGADWYAFDQKLSSTSVQAVTTIYPSRVIVSYPEYPEMFDGPEGTDNTQVIDINAADGQEITGGIPFFAESAFGQGQNEALVVIFKENSIYLLDLATGNTQRIESRGLGCTAPASIAVTRDGINFANNSGVYRLNRNLTISFVGEYVDRIYQDEVNRDALDTMTATHYAIGNRYQLSVPTGTATTNDTVLVYDYQREGKGQEYGAWTEYTNFPATGWANLGNDSFFATTTGEVFRIRTEGDSSDFRDDASAVAQMTILLRAEDFDLSGERKIISASTSHFEMRFSDNVGTTLSVAYDLQSAFETVATFNFTDADNVKIKFAETSYPRRKSVYFQMKYTNSTKDESVILAGVDYTVAALSHKGVNQVGS